jgi:hypothetical protein
MFKKYIPYILLLVAAAALLYIKSHQRGKFPTHTTDNVTVPANIDNRLNRDVNNLIYTKHAKCRMDCRHIDESEVLEILHSGTINYDKIEDDERGKTYPLEGVTHDKQHVRIVFAPKRANEVVVVTVIDLDKDWYCDCK